MTHHQAPAVDEIIQDWPQTARESAQTVLDKYGPPDEATEHMLAWHGNGPWKWTVITDQETPHHFPTPHIDVLEQAIDYKVPVDRYSDLAAFDGSVIVERTRGEISARCEGEEANYLAINLANDIVTRTMTVDQARQRYAEVMQTMTEGGSDPYIERLVFDPPKDDTRDPDQKILDI